ncbi:hypothetical protein ACYFX5_15935 [Bremerella sp. T1]|uniref:hypothetical protein n=1 Tax=Bremerella sp. TYQ1 TaxID=3119568 RepID=UPI001CC9237A|nr:hypothetical protein [Bremerella volcania]UBM34547.1 hypothetical protein LA756_17885 [Bremerella volcania]
MSQPNPFQSPAAESREQEAAVAMVPIVPRPALLSKSSIAAHIWVGAWLAFVVIRMKYDSNEWAFVPSMALFVPLAVWLGVGSGWAGLRMAIVAFLFFVYTRLMTITIGWEPAGFQQDLLGCSILSTAGLTAIIDALIALAVRDFRRSFGMNTSQAITTCIGLCLLVPALFETYLPLFYRHNVVGPFEGSFLVSLTLAAFIIPPTVSLLLRKHSLLQWRFVGMLFAMGTLTAIVSLWVLWQDGSESMQNALMTVPIFQLICAAILFPLDYVLRCWGWSLVEIPMKPVASETTDA